MHQDWSRIDPVEGLGQMAEQKEGLKVRAKLAAQRGLSVGQALPGQPSVLYSDSKWSSII